jgi:hypothetical protein
VTADGRYLLVRQLEGTGSENRVFLQDLQQANSTIEPFLDTRAGGS